MPDSKPYTILLVDDELSILKALQRLLRNKFEVLTAQSGQEALALLQSQPIEVIVTDQRMPGMTGVEFLTAAKAVKPQAARLMLTGYADLQDLTAAVNVGEVQYYLTKPWDPEELVAAVEKAGSQIQQAALARQQTEAELWRERELVHRIAQTSPTGIVFVNPDGQITFANAKAEQVLGLKASAVLGRAFNAPEWRITDYAGQPLAPDDLPFSRVRATGQPVADVRHAIEWPDGCRVLLSVNAAPLFDEAGQLDGIVASLNDVTQAVQAAAAVAEQEEKYRAIMQAVGDNIVVLDDQGHIAYINHVSPGLTPEAVIGSNWLDWLAASDRPIAQAAIHRTLTTQGSETIEYRAIGPQHTMTWFQGKFTYLPGGPEQRAVLTARDITERKRAEEQLERFFDLVPDMVCIASTEGYFQKINSEWQRVLGYTEEELLSTPFADFMHPEDRDKTAREVERQLAGSPTAQFINRYRAKDGAYHWLEWNASPAEDGHTLFAAARDITARKEAEAALRESEARYRSVAQTATDAIITINASGHIVICNQAAETMFGYPEQQMIGQPLASIMPESYHQAHQRSLAQVTRTGILNLSGRTVEVTARRSDGSEFPIELTVARWQSAAEQFFTAIVRDITERRRTDDHIRQLNTDLEQRVAARTAELQQANAELLRASRLKDEFLANMSHELRTPLTAILGLAESLQLGTYGTLSDKQVHWLQVIRQSGQHLLALITDILDLAKVEAGRVELQLGPVAAADVCQTSLQIIKPAALKKNLRVTFVDDPQVGLLRVDARRLKQMLVNLLANAVKFTPEGGQVGLELAGDPEHGEAHFTVWDTGIGIPADKQSLLFQPFVQVDGSLARKYEGTGLGLALTRRLAEMHGGRVSAQSTGAGQGSRFTLTLPWQPALTSPRPADERAPLTATRLTVSTGGPVIVLVVDDNEANLMAVSDFIESLPATVVVARNGHEALAAAAAALPDLILMDIQMPDMDGLEAIKRLRARAETAQTPIIALTALAMPGDRERCLAAGATDYLAKPVVLDELLRLMRTLLVRAAPPTE